MKKVITFILVLVILVSTLVLPAAATTVQPRAPVGHCGCGSYNTEFLGIEYLSGLACYRYHCLDCGNTFSMIV